jgi:hypothetical protein
LVVDGGTRGAYDGDMNETNTTEQTTQKRILLLAQSGGQWMYKIENEDGDTLVKFHWGSSDKSKTIELAKSKFEFDFVSVFYNPAY